MFFDILAKLFTVSGQLAEGNAQAKASRFNRNIERNNEQAALAAGQLAEDRVRREGRRRIGQIEANVGASGFELSGSPLNVLAESAYESSLDALTQRHNYQVKAQNSALKQGLLKSQERSARTSSYVNAASSLIGPKAYSDNQNFTLGGGSN